jgi:hypothetical protein
MELLKRLACGVLAVIIAGCGAGSPPKRELAAAAELEPAKFLITASDGENTSEAVLYFLSNYAFEATAPNEPVEALYDLREMSWTLPATGEKTTLAECREWEQTASEKIRKTQSETRDLNSQTFLDRTLEPQLTAAKNAGTLTIKNEYITYTVRDALRPSEELLANFFRYDILNTYRKCMRDDLLPPFVGLEASSLMWQHGMLPARLTMEVAQPNGNVVSIGVSVEFRQITEKEKQLLEATLAKAQSAPGSAEPAEASPAKEGEA